MSNNNTNSTEAKSTTTYNEKTFIQCSIRRKPGQVGLPGADANERVYKVGSSLDVRTRKALKGVDGKLEKMYMPSIVGVSLNDPSFRKEVEEYWSNISVTIPADQEFLKEYDKGKVIKLNFIIHQKGIKLKLQEAKTIEEKINLLKEAFESEKATLEEDSVADFLFICYCLKYSRVANVKEDIGKSPKIFFYIYNKTSAVKDRMSGIKLRNKAIKLYEKVQDEEKMLDAILISFDKIPTDYDDMLDKAIEVDTLYNANVENTRKFVSIVEDKDWETTYLIKMAVKKGKLSNPVNTESYYYNKLLIGKSLKDAILFLDGNTEEGKNIKKTLEKEIKIE